MIHRHAHNACFSTRPGRSSACHNRESCCFLKRFPGGKPLTVPAPHRRAAAGLAALTRAGSAPRMWELITSHDLPQPWGWESVPKWKGPRVQGPGVPLLEGNGGLLCTEPAEETSDLHVMLVNLEAKQKDIPDVSGTGGQLFVTYTAMGLGRITEAVCNYRPRPCNYRPRGYSPPSPPSPTSQNASSFPSSPGGPGKAEHATNYTRLKNCSCQSGLDQNTFLTPNLAFP